MCQGKEVDLKDLRTPEQLALMSILGPYLQGGLGRGATPFPGQLNAPFDPSQLAAMNVMMKHGGQGGYAPPQMPLNPMMPPPMPPVPPPGPPYDEIDDNPGKYYKERPGDKTGGRRGRDFDPFKGMNWAGNEDERYRREVDWPYRFRDKDYYDRKNK